MTLTQVTTGGVDENINIDSNTLKVDGTNNRVGIGTAAPQTALDIEASGAVARIKAPDQSNARLRIQAGNSSTSFLEFADSDDSDVGEIVYDHYNNDMRFNTNAQERLRINSAGAISIGSATASSLSDRLLQVGSTSRSATYISIVNNTTGTGGLLFADSTDSNDGGYRGQVAYQHASDAMQFWTSANERMRITSSGRMGLGITSPQQRQHIHENSTGASVTQYTNSVTGYTANDGLLVGLDSTEDGLFWIKESQNLTFGTANAERMRIDSAGNVGIGSHVINQTSNNRTVVGINGTSNALLNFNHSNTLAGFMYGAGDEFRMEANGTRPLIFRGNSTERMRIDDAGRVLVGRSDSSTGAKLEVEGRVSGKTLNTYQVSFSTFSTSAVTINYTVPSASGIMMYVFSASSASACQNPGLYMIFRETSGAVVRTIVGHAAVSSIGVTGAGVITLSPNTSNFRGWRIGITNVVNI